MAKLGDSDAWRRGFSEENCQRGRLFPPSRRCTGLQTSTVCLWVWLRTVDRDVCQQSSGTWLVEFNEHVLTLPVLSILLNRRKLEGDDQVLEAWPARKTEVYGFPAWEGASNRNREGPEAFCATAEHAKQWLQRRHVDVPNIQQGFALSRELSLNSGLQKHCFCTALSGLHVQLARSY